MVTWNRKVRLDNRRQIEVGERFGRLIVEEVSAPYLWRGTANHRRLACRCECGKVHTARADQLKTGFCRSCGCMRRDSTVERSVTHGFRRDGERSSEYNLWRDLRRHFPDEVVAIWLTPKGKGFSRFLHDVGYRPTSSHRLVRIDPKNPWSRKNCRWVDSPKRVGTPVKWFRVGTRRLTLGQASEESGIAYGTLWRRLQRGIPLSKAMIP